MSSEDDRKYNSLNFIKLESENSKPIHENNNDDDTSQGRDQSKRKHKSLNLSVFSKIFQGSNTPNSSPSSTPKKSKNHMIQKDYDGDHYLDDFIEYLTPPTTPSKNNNNNVNSNNNNNNSSNTSIYSQHHKYNQLDCKFILEKIQKDSDESAKEFYKLLENLKSFSNNSNKISLENMKIYSKTCLDISNSTISNVCNMQLLINNMELLNSDLFETIKLYQKIKGLKKMVDDLEIILKSLEGDH